MRSREKECALSVLPHSPSCPKRSREKECAMFAPPQAVSDPHMEQQESLQSSLSRRKYACRLGRVRFDKKEKRS